MSSYAAIIQSYEKDDFIFTKHSLQPVAYSEFAPGLFFFHM